jgi:hypothetical protein
MKRIILIPILALIMVSCQSDKENTLAANENMNGAIEAMKLQLEQQKMELAKQKVIDSMQMIAELRLPMDFASAPATKVERKVVYQRAPKRYTMPAQTPTVQTPPIAESPAPVESTTIPATPVEKEKKGWSNTAKGAVIGAGVGAIGGAVIGKKNRVKGAVIGGLIGAAAGAGTGILIDRKQKQNQLN